ncbi:Hpt domain-containing protein [uncultured Cohaesibacter sp.]|uniref:Hpt domain-containing protein n=1 Tax=uncultured Cohaesibacter sp. TaxID=1002546 RepID=UPI0029C8D8B7|nr:Hpt domain-containing protein [uncultured Cohaesibacter sp.]
MIDQLRALITKHCATLGREMDEINLSLTKLQCAGDQCSLVAQEAAGKAHKVKGSSGTIGFKQISQSAADLELYLRQLGEQPGPLTNEQEKKIELLFGRLRILVEGATPEQSSLYDAQIPFFANKN